MVKINRKLATERIDEGRGSHPMLANGGAFYGIYTFIKNTPDCTTADLRARGYNHQRVSDLLVAGLVTVSGRRGKFNTYRVAEENETGYGRDAIHIEVTVFKNIYGEFSINARLLGQIPGSADLDTHPRAVSKKTVRVLVPRDKESHKTRPIIDVQTTAPTETDGLRKEPLTIEAEYTIVEPDKT